MHPPGIPGRAVERGFRNFLPTSHDKRARSRPRRLRLEPLEKRQLLSVIPQLPENVDLEAVQAEAVAADVAERTTSDAPVCAEAPEATSPAAQAVDEDASKADDKQYEANQPIGVAQGLHPGRVTWVHDPEATSWNGSSGYWWDDNNTNAAVVEQMMSDSIRWLAGRPTDAAAWDAVFRNFNQTRHGVDSGYTPGEKIAIKVNMNNSSSHGNTDNNLDASPQLVRALVRQLVDEVGMAPGDITIYDASRAIADRVFNPIHAEFPDVQFVDRYGGNGRIQVQGDSRPEHMIYLSGGTRESLQVPTVVTEADYTINVANLKRHTLAGMTMTAKNCFGSIRQFRNGNWEWSPSNLHGAVSGDNPMESYRCLVDLLGHKHTGDKTLLYMIDGLYGAMDQSGNPQRWSSFGNDWPSSLFLSQDPVAIDSVGLDFLRAETSVMPSTEDFLHEAALADNPPSGTTYDPEDDGTPLTSLGVHEHWNNAVARQYSRNLGTGEGIELVAEKPVPPSKVVGRHVFYNNSSFDGNDPQANARDDDAVALDKEAVLPGDAITFAGYTSYSRGINGIMIDVEDLPYDTALSSADFEFRVGNGSDLSSWSPAPDPSSITIRPGGGEGGSDRVTITWPDNSIRKQWLQVTMLATVNTALPENDVFCFGNAIGEAGNAAGEALVNALDVLLARNNPRTLINPAPIDFPYDYNRDARVNATDLVIARSNQTHLLDALDLRLSRVETKLVGQGVPLSYHVPEETDAALGTDWTAPEFDDAAWTGGRAPSPVLITEAGTSDDFVEIQNVSGEPVDTSGWVVAVNNASGRTPNVNNMNTIFWELPASMGPDDVLYRHDDDLDPDHYWGENIFFRTAGFGWVVIVDSAGDVADFVVFGYTPAEVASLAVTVNGFDVTAAGAWTGGAIPSGTTDGPSLQRRGDSDGNLASDWHFVAVTSQGLQNDDLTVPFLGGPTTGIGFSSNPDGFAGAIQTDIEVAMRGVNPSLWTRVRFEVDRPGDLDELLLQMKYNDGFVAYLNGREIASSNAPAEPLWNFPATGTRSYEESSVFEQIDVTGFLDALESGTNVLAIHGLNNTVTDTEFVILPELIGVRYLLVMP